MTLALNIGWPPRQNRFVHKTCRFPASTLSSQPPAAPAGQPLCWHAGHSAADMDALLRPSLAIIKGIVATADTGCDACVSWRLCLKGLTWGLCICRRRGTSGGQRQHQHRQQRTVSAGTPAPGHAEQCHLPVCGRHPGGAPRGQGGAGQSPGHRLRLPGCQPGPINTYLSPKRAPQAQAGIPGQQQRGQLQEGGSGLRGWL